MQMLSQNSVFHILTRGLGTDPNSKIVYRYLEKAHAYIKCGAMTELPRQYGGGDSKLMHIKDS